MKKDRVESTDSSPKKSRIQEGSLLDSGLPSGLLIRSIDTGSGFSVNNTPFPRTPWGILLLPSLLSPEISKNPYDFMGKDDTKNVKEQIDRKIIELRRYLISLIRSYPIVGLKGGTETEDMDSDEIRVLHMVAKDLVPVTVKIGGPEARTDIRMLVKEEIEGISAPMIESSYALKNFISTLKSMLTPVTYSKVTKAINLETITGYKNLLEIADSKAFEELDQVTAARSDLSSSMGLIPDDEEVMKVTRTIIAISRDRGKKTSVGGTITKQNFRKIAEEIRPDKINSRHVCVDVAKSAEKVAEEVAEAMLLFEMELYDLFSVLKPEKAYGYKNRIETNRERIGSRKVLYSIR